jgi:hypothetical protein
VAKLTEESVSDANKNVAEKQMGGAMQNWLLVQGRATTDARRFSKFRKRNN